MFFSAFFLSFFIFFSSAILSILPYFKENLLLLLPRPYHLNLKVAAVRIKKTGKWTIAEEPVDTHPIFPSVRNSLLYPHCRIAVKLYPLLAESRSRIRNRNRSHHHHHHHLNNRSSSSSSSSTNTNTSSSSCLHLATTVCRHREEMNSGRRYRHRRTICGGT